MHYFTSFTVLKVIEFLLFSKIKFIFKESRCVSWKTLKETHLHPTLLQVHKAELYMSLPIVTQGHCFKGQFSFGHNRYLLKIISFISP